jgi:uncharacterized membrane protein
VFLVGDLAAWPNGFCIVMTVRHVPRWLLWGSLLLALGGLGVSAYLTYAHYASASVLSCPDTGLINCQKVTTSPQAMLFGAIPVATLGLLYFVGMSALTAPWAWHRLSRVTDAARTSLAFAGMGFVVYLVYVEVHVLGAICLYCTVVHALTFLLFAATLLIVANTVQRTSP